MADSARIIAATGKSRDGITGEVIEAGTPVAHVMFNSRCAPFLTAESLRRLADEIEKGEGWLFRAVGPVGEPERWKEMGWEHKNQQRLRQQTSGSAG